MQDKLIGLFTWLMMAATTLLGMLFLLAPFFSLVLAWIDSLSGQAPRVPVEVSW